jgi:hypothetical protein
MGKDEVIVYSQIISSKRRPDNVVQELADAMSNPVIGPIIVIGAYFLGVPPEGIKAMGSAAAAAAAEKAKSSRESPKKGVFIDRLTPPAGYAMCAARLGLLSIHPRKKGDDRPRVNVSGSNSGVVITTAHQGQDWLDGTSKVKIKADLMAVKIEAMATYKDKCLGDRSVDLVSLCRGKECNPKMSGSAWLAGK